MAINSYKDLEVWQAEISMAEDRYRLTASFPKEETYRMTSQLRRASVSVPANIAEGYGRDQTGSHIQFLRIVQGSARERETHLIPADRLKLANTDALLLIQDPCDRVGPMLRALIPSREARTQ